MDATAAFTILGRLLICRRSRREAKSWTRAPTYSRSVACCTKRLRAYVRSEARLFLKSFER